MRLKISINDSLNLADKFKLPEKMPNPFSRVHVNKAELSINVPDGLGTKDNLATYKPWFNGMKHFYTVKSLPPKPKQ